MFNWNDLNRRETPCSQWLFRIDFDLDDHTQGQRWAAGRSYCRSINQCFLQSWAPSAAQHRLWCAVMAASATVTLNTSADQVAADWPCPTTQHSVLRKHHRSSQKDILEEMKPDGVNVNGFTGENQTLAVTCVPSEGRNFVSTKKHAYMQMAASCNV